MRTPMKIAIIGFGMMGQQIAQVFAQNGHDVSVTDENPEVLRTGLDSIETGPYGIRSLIAKGKMTNEQGAVVLHRIRATPSISEACKDAGVIVEAVFEDLRLKQRIFETAEFSADPTALLASNTSTLSIAKIAATLRHKDRALGMHFFNPAQITKLVEIVRTEETSAEAVDLASKTLQSMGKAPILARDEPGFVANRLGLTLFVEASKLVEDRIAEVRDVDSAMKLGYNHPMGPFELADFVGLDTRLRNLEALYESTGDVRWIPPKTLRELVNKGYLGDPARKKGSRGGYYEFLGLTRP